MTTIGYIIFYLICALNIFMGIRKKKSNVLYTVAMAVIFVLMTFNYYGPDIEVYMMAYEVVGEASDLQVALNATYMEKGYAFLMFSANKVGLDFYAFRIIISIICLALFASTIKYYKVNSNFIIGLYMAYIFFFDTIQLRNCIIQFIILFATRFLFQKSTTSLIKYILCIVIAGCIHTISWLFISLLLLRFVKTWGGYKNLFKLSVFMFILCVLLKPILPHIINVVARILKRGLGYLNFSVNFSYWIVMFFHLLSLVPFFCYRKKVQDKEVKNKITYIMQIEIIIGLFLPLCFINGSFYRIFRNVVILDTIGLALLYENTKKHTQANDVTLATQLLLVGGWLATDLVRNREMNIISYAMEYNLIYMQVSSAEIWKYAMVIVASLAILFVIKKLFPYNGQQRKKELKCA